MPLRSLDPRLVGVVLAGLVIRAALLANPGYAPDIAFWKSYLTYANVFGIQNVYGLETSLQPYPPVLLYLLWGLGSVYTGIWPEARDTPLLTAFVKLPAVTADLIAALLLAAYARRRRGGATLSPVRSAALLALHPAWIWISAYWGQVDILHGGLAAAAWGAALAGSSGLAGFLLAVCLLTKPQGLILLPAGAALILGRSGGRGLLRAAGFGGGAAALLVLPFVVAGYAGQLARLYLGITEIYPYLTVHAFNPWWIVALICGGGRDRPLVGDDGAVLGFVTPRLVGLALFAIATAWIAWRSIRAARDPGSGPGRAWRLLTLQWLAFFLLPTHIHERYLAPALIAMAPALILEPRWKWVYLVLSAAVWLNVAYILPGRSWLLAAVRVLSGEGILVAVGLVWAASVLVRAELREGSDAGAR